MWQRLPTLLTATAFCNGTCQLESCDSGYGNCDGYEYNGCEQSLNETDNCGACGSICAEHETCSNGSCYCGNDPSCQGNTYCYEGQGCYDLPTISFTPSCSNIGIEHTAPNYLYTFTVHGRPGAAADQYNHHVSCGTAAELAATWQLDATGTYVDSPETEAYGCLDTLGRWEVWVMVDGHESNHVFATYYNPGCAGAETCAAAASHCPN